MGCPHNNGTPETCEYCLGKKKWDEPKTCEVINCPAQSKIAELEGKLEQGRKDRVTLENNQAYAVNQVLDKNAEIADLTANLSQAKAEKSGVEARLHIAEAEGAEMREALLLVQAWDEGGRLINGHCYNDVKDAYCKALASTLGTRTLARLKAAEELAKSLGQFTEYFAAIKKGEVGGSRLTIRDFENIILVAGLEALAKFEEAANGL